MIVIRTILATVFAIIGFFHLDAQETAISDLKNSQLKQYFKSALRANDYYTQIDYLKELVKRDDEKLKYHFRLARAYDQSRDFQNALTEYSKAYYGDQDKYAVCLFHMARIMKTREQYKFAKLYLDKFEKENIGKNDGDKYKKLVKAELAGIEMATKADENDLETAETHLENEINHANIEFSPFIIDSNNFWFVAFISDSVVFKVDNEEPGAIPKRKVYQAQKSEGEWKLKGEADIAINALNDKSIGSFSQSEDGNRIYFTSCKPNWKNQIRCKLFMLRKDDAGTWSEPLELHEEINSNKYTNTHPSVGKSAKPDREIIYFVSDRPGGKGGLDIWYTRYRISKKRFDKPQNCGTKVNTMGEEMTPSFDNKSYKLYFSSTGWPSYGGLDVQYATGEGSRWNGKAKNAGIEVNSPVDDMYYQIFPNRKDAIVVSNREGSISLKHPHCCDDLFLLEWKNLIRHELTGTITNEETNKPEPGVEVRLIIKNDEENTEYLADKVITDENGNYKILLEENTDYRLVYHKEKFFNNADSTTTVNIKEPYNIEKNQTLKPIPDVEIVIPNILYAFDDTSLNAAAMQTLDTSIYLLLIENPSLIIEIGSHTDNKGSDDYNLSLSQRRAESVINYLQKKGIDKKRIQAKGYGETKPVAANMNTDGTDNPAGRAKNRRTSFRVVGQIDISLTYDDDESDD